VSVFAHACVWCECSRCVCTWCWCFHYRGSALWMGYYSVGLPCSSVCWSGCCACAGRHTWRVPLDV